MIIDNPEQLAYQSLSETRERAEREHDAAIREMDGDRKGTTMSNPTGSDWEFEETTVAEVETCDTGWSIKRADGWSLFVTNDNEKRAPEPGETMRCYGRGIGYSVRGIVIGGRVYRYESPDEHKQSQVKMIERIDREQEQRAAEFRETFTGRPPLPAFALADPDGWAACVKNNSSDPYSYACVEYAAGWASLMEQRMQTGDTVATVAKQASHDADVGGITGFMYGAAVSMLAHCWKHGEELRKWHNGEYGVTSGDGVVNPAIMTIGAP